MVIRIGIAVSLVCLCLGCTTGSVGYPPIEYETGEVVVAPAENGTGATIAVDVLGAAKWKALSNARWYRKADVAVSEYVAKPIARNPWKTVTGAGAVLIGVRAAEGKLDDDLKGIWEGLGLRDEDKPAPKPEPPAELFDGTGATTYGDNSPIYMETDDENAVAETHGDNSPITIVKPPPVLPVE